MRNEKQVQKTKESELPFAINIDDAGLRDEFNQMAEEFIQERCNPLAVGVKLNIKGKIIVRHAIKAS